MLSDAQIERWSRQILLPDVGGRGQARLLAARIALAGSGRVADGAGDLLARAGVPVARGAVCDDADLLLDLEVDAPGSAALARRALAAGVPLVRGRLAGAAGSVHTLLGRPCGLCVTTDSPAPATAPGPLAAPAAQALAALVAAETLAALLAPPRRGRVQRFDLLGGEFTGAALDAAGCDVCGGRA